MNFICVWLISILGGGIYVVGTDRDVPLIWVCIFSDLVRVLFCNSCSRYMHHLYFLSNGTRVLWVVILYQVKNTCFIGNPGYIQT